MKSKILILGIFVFLVSLLITLNVIFHQSLSDELVAQFNKQQVLVAKGISSSISTALDRETKKLRLLTSLISSYPSIDRETIRKITAEAFAFSNEIRTHATVYNKEGRVIFTTIQLPLLMRSDNIDYFNKAKDFSDGETGIFHDMKRVIMVSPVHRGEEFAGGVILEVMIDDLARMYLTPFKSMQKGYAWLMDGTGNLLYHPTEFSMIGKNLYNAQEECFRCHRSFDLEKKVLEDPFVETGRYIAPNKEDKVLAFSIVNIGENSPWIICVSSPYTEVISLTERSMRLYSGLVVAIFATVFLGASIIVLNNRQRMKTEKESKEAVLLEKQKLDTIVSAIGAGLMLVDNEHRILWVNETLHKWAGNVEGQNCGVICPLCPPKVMSGEISHDIFHELFGKRGSVFQVTSAPIRDKDGGVAGVLKLIQDVTEIKKLEAGILHSEKLAALGRLAAGVAHEIGNPLTSISSFVQILMERAEDNFTKDSLGTVYHHIQRISEIVGQMSKLSKLPDMNIREHDINRIIDASLDIIKYDDKLKDVKIEKELSDGLPAIHVDENYLLQVFINLLLNAADAIEDGKGTIAVKSMRDNNSVAVRFSDTGIGMTEECIRNIFDPFFTTKETGTGLGLPISYEIVKKLGGSLEVKSRAGEGSIFSVILPVKESG